MSKQSQRANRSDIEAALKHALATATGIDPQRLTVAYFRKEKTTHWAIHRKGKWCVEVVWNIRIKGSLFRRNWEILLRELDEVMRRSWPVRIDHLPKQREV